MTSCTHVSPAIVMQLVTTSLLDCCVGKELAKASYQTFCSFTRCVFPDFPSLIRRACEIILFFFSCAQEIVNFLYSGIEVKKTTRKTFFNRAIVNLNLRSSYLWSYFPVLTIASIIKFFSKGGLKKKLPCVSSGVDVTREQLCLGSYMERDLCEIEKLPMKR